MSRSLSFSILICCCLLFLAGCESCREAAEEIIEICDATPSTVNLLSVRPADYDEFGSKYLVGTHQTMYLCDSHFAVGTAARSEVHAANYEVNRVEECALLINSLAQPHADKATLFGTPSVSYFDYVDNTLSGTHECHPDTDDIACSSWVMNTCRYNGSEWGGSGTTTHWVISANANCYDHYSDPTSDDHPYKHGVLHELGHAWGMNHTSAWDSADEAYISTMQGKLVYLSALDVGYLRYRYPETGGNPHRNYVAGSKTRFDEGGGVFTKMVFSEDNPDEFYVNADGELKDCSTDDDPYFYVAWFNTGSQDGETEICGVNRIFLRSTTSDDTVELYTWRIATMPNLSQDQWRGSVVPDVDEIAKIDLTDSYELVFRVNGWGTLDELTDEDNELSYPVSIYESSSCVR